MAELEIIRTATRGRCEVDEGEAEEGCYLVCFVYLVDLVHLVYLVGLVYPVSLVQPNKQDKPNNSLLPPRLRLLHIGPALLFE